MSYVRILQKNFAYCRNRWNVVRNTECSRAVCSQNAKYVPGSSMLGYLVKKVEKIPELNMTAVLLEHKSIGVNHLHLDCDDTNNLFFVGLKTTPHDSTGVPHILEHLSLCGSKRFPCRDPFFNMLNRSLATYVNASTGCDSTMYYFSSQNAKDYKNLLSVYLDAVFFPLLDEKDFRQEGWRLEHEDIKDKNSPIILKGVVFNEMKGVFSDPNMYYMQQLQNALFPSNTYSYVHGGDPLVIPSLKWEDLKAFHAKHYHPSNSRFLTYGNMPLQDHLEHIENYVLKHFQRIATNAEVPDEKIWSHPREMHVHNRFDPMAAIPDKQTIVSNSYLLNNITDTHENFTLSMLGTLLVDGPNSPFYQSLLESGIGPDYSPCTGFDGSLKQSIFSVGVREIAEKDIGMVKDIIESTFDNVVKTGFPDVRIKSVLHYLELAMKNRSANFGLNCAMGVNALWNHNGNPVSGFMINEHITHFVKQMEANPHYLQDKVAQYFKNNNHKLTLIMSPKEDFEAESQNQEKKLLESKLACLSDAEKMQIYTEGLQLAEHQKVSDASCLPTLYMSDVDKCNKVTPLKCIKMKDVEVQACEQPTNELVYFNAIMNVSVPEDYIMLLPLFSSIVTQMGAGKRNYKELDQEIQLKTGGFDVSIHVSENPENIESFEKGLSFSSYCLEKNMGDMFSLWEDIFNALHLEDRDRLSHLIRLSATDLAQGILYKAHKYAIMRANSVLSVCDSLREETSGLSQISYMKKLAEMENHDEILGKLKDLSKLLLQKKSMRCAINATPMKMPKALERLELFLDTITQSKESTYAEKYETQQSNDMKTHFILPIPVNYLGQGILTIPYCHKDFASLKVAAKLMSSKFLHSEIREKGGAYGAGAALNKGGQFMFYSYRDPNVSKTLTSFTAGIEWLLKATFSDQDINEAKLGVFSEVDAPTPPGYKGIMYFKDRVSDEMKQKLRENVFSCKKEDLVLVGERYLKNPPKAGVTLIGPENEQTNSASSGWTIIKE